MLSAQTTDVNVNRVTERAVREVPAARGLPRRAGRGARARHLPDRLLPAEGEVAPRDDGDAARGVRRRGARRGSRSCCACRASRARRRTSSPPSAASAQGIVVDTHVRRLSQRLGLTRQDDPVKIERDLMRLVPRARLGRLPAPADLARPPRLRSRARPAARTACSPTSARRKLGIVSRLDSHVHARARSLEASARRPIPADAMRTRSPASTREPAAARGRAGVTRRLRRGRRDRDESRPRGAESATRSMRLGSSLGLRSVIGRPMRRAPAELARAGAALLDAARSELQRAGSRARYARLRARA